MKIEIKSVFYEIVIGIISLIINCQHIKFAEAAKLNHKIYLLGFAQRSRMNLWIFIVTPPTPLLSLLLL